MDVSQAPNATETSAPERAGLSPFARAIAIFTNPSGAWAGLERQAQWWFPLLLILASSAIVLLLVYQRAIVPMNAEQFDSMVEAGRMTADQAAQAQERMSGPMGLVFGMVSQVVFVPIIMLLLAAGVAFGVSFMVGTKLAFRQAFEIVLWANLVMIPAGFLTAILAWSKETMRGIHLGPGILVPMSDPPEKWQMGVASFLDAFGPFEIWTVALVILGATALSGASRKSVTWAIVGLYLAARLVGAGLAAIFAPGA